MSETNKSAVHEHTHAKDANVLELLKKRQNKFGYISEDFIAETAKNFNMPVGEVYGVATFYHLFTMRPPGKHTCVVCLGTACYIRGAQAIIDRVSLEMKVKPGETTEDGNLSFLTARCLGSCGLAPAVVYDGAVAGKQTADNTLERVKKLIQ